MHDGVAPKVVSHRALVAAWDTAVRAGISARALGDDLRKVVEGVRRSRERVDWDVFIELKDRVRALAGGREGLQQVYLAYHQYFPELQRFAKLFASARQLYQFTCKTMGVALYSHVTAEFEELGRNRARLTVALPPQYRDGTSFFEAMVSGMRGLPRFIDAPLAEVDAELSSHGGVYLIRLGPSRTLPSKMAPAVRALLDEFQMIAAQLQELTRMNATTGKVPIELLAKHYGLTPRQREVATLIMKGKSNKEISAELGCAERTVELHVTALMRKTRTNNRTQLAARLLKP